MLSRTISSSAWSTIGASKSPPAIRSAAVIGVEAIPVDVEVESSLGLPHFALVGLAGGAPHVAVGLGHHDEVGQFHDAALDALQFVAAAGGRIRSRT